MRGKLRYIIIKMLLMSCLCVCAQNNTYDGTVCDVHGQPLDMVSVVILNESGSPVSYTRTDENGRFVLSCDTSRHAVSMSFSFIGYERKIVPLPEFRNGSKVTLAEQPFSLNEVKVVSRRIEEKKDTLTYSVAGFKQAQDRSIADVLSKMPGIEVKKNGVIEYLGKPINKFYIEGLDLLGGKYRLASENLSADKVKSVQVLQNHQPVKMLRDIKFSDGTALNLVLKDDAKNVWTGVAEVGSGAVVQGETEWNRDARIMLMCFGRKMQTISMYKTNNTGKDIAEEINELISEEDRKYEMSSPVSGVGVCAADLKDERTLFNDSHLFASNWLYKAREDVDLRLQLNAFHDKTGQKASVTTSYSDLNDETQIVETTDANMSHGSAQMELMYKLNADNVYLMNKARGALDYAHDKAMTVLNGRETPQNVKVDKRYMSDSFSFMRKYDNKKQFEVKADVVYNDMPGLLLVSDGRTENVDMSSLNVDAETSFSHTLSSFHIYYKAGFQGQLSDIKASLGDEFDDKERYVSLRPYVLSSAMYANRDVKVKVNARMSMVSRDYDGQKDVMLLAEPNASFSYIPSTFWDYSLRYTYNRVLSELTEMTDIPMYVSYITRIENSGELLDSHSHYAILSVRYKNAMAGFFANVSLSGKLSTGNDLYKSELVDGVYVRRSSHHQCDHESYSLSGRVSKAIAVTKANVALSGSYRTTRYDLLVSDVVNACETRNYNVSLSFSFRPLKMLSFEEESRMCVSEQLNRACPSLSADKMTWMNHTLKSYLMIGKWQLEWVNDLYHSRDESVSFNYFSDLSVCYRDKINEWKLSLNNILGASEYVHRKVYDYYRNVSSIELRRREFLLSYSRSF